MYIVVQEEVGPLSPPFSLCKNLTFFFALIKQNIELGYFCFSSPRIIF